MAAGLGSRFGGCKQLAKVGINGEAFLDFAIADAVTAGVSKVVLIVRSEIEDAVRTHIGDRYGDLEIGYVCQDEHGPKRLKPWGTAHAVLATADEVPGPFVVCNADDYYGRSAFVKGVAKASTLGNNQALLVGFRLAATLADTGTVSRGICRLDGSAVVSIVETHGIRRQSDGSVAATEPFGAVAPEALVSMNFWAFSHQIFAFLEDAFASFQRRFGDHSSAEFMLPAVINDLLSENHLSVEMIPSEDTWIGVTNRADLASAQKRIAALELVA